MLSLLLALIASAADEPDFKTEVHGDIKTFGIAVFPYDHVVMGTTYEPGCADLSGFPLPPDVPADLCIPDPTNLEKVPATPSGTGVWNVRLKLESEYKDVLRFEVHHLANATLGGSGGGQVQGFGTGVAQGAPEVVDLSWDAELEGDSLGVIGITDRLLLQFSQPGIDVTLGRQPVSFGNGLFFTPIDLVNPFTPTTIDTEYKPGVDALRVDGYFGMTGKVTLVGAYAGDWKPDEMALAAYGQGTVGVTDLGGFAGLIYNEPVLGVSAVSSIGAFGVHTDLALTLPTDEDPFVRGVVGTLWRPTGTSTLSAEAYLQTFGTTDPDEYLLIAQQDRFARGQVWNWGVGYVGLSWAEEITPLVSANLGLISNVTDPSTMVTPSINWSIADNAVFGIGGFGGLGARPDADVRPEDLVDPVTFQPLGPRATAAAMGLNSEFGTYPIALFTNMKAYF